MKFALLPRETRGDTVTATMTFRFGDLQDARRGKIPLASFTGALLSRGTDEEDATSSQRLD